MTEFERRMIGPEEAKELLTYNTSNRPIDERRIRQYSEEMLAGKWLEMGCISIYKQGDVMRLEDGQHRLLSIQQTRVTLPIWVEIVGFEARVKKDIGKPRSLNDLVAIDFPGQDRNIISRATTATCILDFYANGSYTRFQAVSPSDRLLHGRTKRTEISWLAGVTHDLKKGLARRIPGSGWLSGYLHLHRDIGVEAAAFIQRVATGEMLVSDDPRYVLRRQMLETGLNGTGDALRQAHNIVVRAWNKYQKGETAQFINAGTGWLEPVAERRSLGMFDRAAD